MQAFVNPDLCIGCTQCAGICPDVFSMDGSLAVAISGAVPDEAASSAAEAAQTCPVAAIQLDT